MAILSIIGTQDEGHEILKTVCAEVTNFNDELYQLVCNMKQSCLGYGAAGLAANQVGVPLRLFVMDISKRDDDFEVLALINPKIIKATGKVTYEEGCLSFKDRRRYKIKRKSYVEVEYQDVKGETKQYTAVGFQAVCIQHEINHLDGITMEDIWEEQRSKKGWP